jgi:hypothetical protein
MFQIITGPNMGGELFLMDLLICYLRANATFGLS